MAFTVDRKFLPCCAVTMLSVLENNDPAVLAFHVVGDGLEEGDKRRLRQLAESRGGRVYFYSVPEECVRGYEVKWKRKRLSKIVFYRCLFAPLLPETVSKVLYLDCDLLVLAPLDGLWATDLDGKALAAVPDAYTVNAEHCRRLGYDAVDNYFNGGVLLLNLDYWRRHGLEQQCRDYYLAHADRMLYNDQDLLNGMFHGRTVLLDMKWNVQESAYRLSRKGLADRQPLYMETLRHPSILHYSGRKPWQYHCMHPLKDRWLEYACRVPGMEPGTERWQTRLRRFVHFLPYTLGLKADKYMDLKKNDERKE